MSEMIDRVAAALFNVGPVPGEWSDLSDDSETDRYYRERYRLMARAAIEAMRDNCSEAMIRAFWDKSASPDFYPDDSSASEWYGDTDDFKKGFAAMINEALR